MPVLYANRAFSTLAANITDVATSLSVAAGHGARFPTISGSDYFYATLDNNAGSVEIVKVTARSTDTFTIVRAQDGTSALAFNAGAGVELRVVKAMLDDLKTDAFTGANLSYSGTLTGGTGVVNLGSGQLYKDASGNVGIGTASPSTLLNIFSATAAILAVDGNSNTNVRVTRYSNDATGPQTALRKYRGTLAAPAAVATNDFVGNLTFTAYGGTAARIVASVSSQVTNYTSDTNLSAALIFSTANASSAATEMARITATGNLGIGSASPDEKLVVAGAITASGQAAANKTSAGTFDFYGPDKAVRFLSWGPVGTVGAFSFWSGSGALGATEKMRLDASGNLGIGTTSPTEKVTAAAGGIDRVGMHISGTVTQLRLGSYGAGDAMMVLQYNRSTGTYQFSEGTNGNTSSPDIVVDASGNLGIGATPTANERLRVEGTEARIRSRNSTSGTEVYVGAMNPNEARLWTSTSSVLTFGTNNTEVARFDASGNLGIGTAPSTKLHVRGTGAQELRISTDTSGDPKLQLNAEGVNGGSLRYSRANQQLVFTNNVDSVYITTAGRLGVGTASPGSPLHVEGATNSVQIRAGDGNVLTYVAYSSGTGTSAINYHGTGSNHPQAFITNNQERARFDVNGNFLVGTGDAAGDTANTAVSLAGIFRSRRLTGSAAHNTATTFITLSSSPAFATYIVSAGIESTADPENYHCVSIICTQNGAARITNTVTAILFTITLSGMSIQLKQNSGVTQTCALTITRVA